MEEILIGFYGGFGNLLRSIFENKLEYSFLLILVVILYFLILKKHINSIFDPFTVSLFASAVVCTDIIYMYFNNLMQISPDINIICFFMTEISYLGGILIFRPVNIKKNVIIHENNKVYIDLVYYIYSVFFIIIQLYSMVFVGLPLFQDESRLAFYKEGTGAFFIVSKSISFIVILLFYDRVFSSGNRRGISFLFSIIVGVFLLIFFFGSGAKSGILLLVNILYLYLLFMKKTKKTTKEILQVEKYLKNGLCVAVLSAIFILYLKSDSGVLYLAVIRIIGFGDMHAFWYSMDFKNIIEVNNYFSDSLTSLLAAFRFIDYSDLKISESQEIGTQVLNYFSNITVYAGPNSRHNIIGEVYFGLSGAIIHSFLLGVIISYVRNVFCLYFNGNIILYSIYAQTYMYACSIAYTGALSHGFKELFYFILINVPLLLSIYILYLFIPKK